MKKQLTVALLFTIVTTILFGVLYPLAVTGLSSLLFADKAKGSLIVRDGQIVGSKLIGQRFSSDKYFHSRPSFAGAGYDAASSSPSNLGPTNQQLIERVKQDIAKLHQENPSAAIPADLVTSSGSGLDPDISPAAAEFQIPRIARTRNISTDSLRQLIAKHTEPRQFGILGEPRVHVLELNLDLDDAAPTQK
jgi:K+-transporting ATPase ATPase C chain